MKRISDFLAWLGGGEKEFLDQVRHERARFVQMALVLLTTASIAMVSMIFAMNDGVHVPLPVAVLIGIFWGFVILNLDRFLVLSMGATRAGRRLFLMALPRLLLATVISIVIATPLTLRVFQHDISVQVQKSQATESRQLKELVAQSGPAQEASQVQSKINADEQILAGHLPVNVTNPQLQDAQAQVNALQPKVQAAQTAMDNAQAAYQCEVDGSGLGCEGASDKVGYGPLAKLKKSEYEQKAQAYNNLNTQLQNAERAVNAAEQSMAKSQGQTLAQDQKVARQALPGLQTQEKQLQAQVQQNEKNAQNAVNNDNGILAQLSGLSAAGANNPVLFLAQVVVTLLFFFIEILPVMVKFMLNMGPLSDYETVAKAEGEKIKDRAKLDRVNARRDAERDSDEQMKLKDGHSSTRANVAKDMRRREEALGVRANEHVASEMEAILDAQLAEWSRRVQAQLGGRGQQGNGAPPGPPGPGSGYNASGAQNGNGWPHGTPAWPGNVAAPPARQTWTPPPATGFGLPQDGEDLL